MFEYFSDLKINFLNIIFSLQLLDYLEVAILTVIIYYILRFIRDTRAEQLTKGILIFIILLFLLKQVNFKVLGTLSELILSMGVTAFIVMFQPELRRALEKVGRSKVANRITFKDLAMPELPENIMIERLANSCEKLSRTATGALIVIERKTKLGEQIETGTVIDAIPGEQIIGNIFFTNSPLHDGALIIRDNKLYAAGCFLPKPQNEEGVSKDLGTRHRAAIGISEISDAVVIIVSEETGIISVAENGALKRGFDKNRLIEYLTDKLIGDIEDKRQRRKSRSKHIKHNASSKENKKKEKGNGKRKKEPRGKN